MSQPLRIHYHSSSYSSTHNNNSNYSYCVQSSSFPSSSSSSSLSLTSSTSPSSPISISFRPLYSPLTALPQQHHELGDSPISIELTPISSDDQFDQLLAHTHHHQHPLIIVWLVLPFFFFFFFCFCFSKWKFDFMGICFWDIENFGTILLVIWDNSSQRGESVSVERESEGYLLLNYFVRYHYM